MDVMSGLFCIYEGPVEKDGVVQGGALNVRTREGFVVAVFASEALARSFLTRFKLEETPPRACPSPSASSSSPAKRCSRPGRATARAS